MNPVPLESIVEVVGEVTIRGAGNGCGGKGDPK